MYYGREKCAESERGRFVRKITLLATAVILAVGMVAVPAMADEGGADTYLALGDSVAAGMQAPQPFTDHGYADLLFKNIADDYSFNEFVNLACPGDDTGEMIDGDNGPGGGSHCYGTGAPFAFGADSQLQAAVAYLSSHPGEVGLITITIGANDILACDSTAPDFGVCVGGQLGQMAANLSEILWTLQSAAPGVPIVGMNYYNPNLAYWLVDPAIAEASLRLTTAFNGTLEAVYGGFGVPVADVETAFRTFKTKGDVPQNVRTVCLYTGMCEKQGPSFVLSDYNPGEPGPQTDIHPSDKGYRKISGVFGELIDDLGILSG